MSNQGLQHIWPLSLSSGWPQPSACWSSFTLLYSKPKTFFPNPGSGGASPAPVRLLLLLLLQERAVKDLDRGLGRHREEQEELQVGPEAWAGVSRGGREHRGNFLIGSASPQCLNALCLNEPCLNEAGRARQQPLEQAPTRRAACKRAAYTAMNTRAKLLVASSLDPASTALSWGCSVRTCARSDVQEDGSKGAPLEVCGFWVHS